MTPQQREDILNRLLNSTNTKYRLQEFQRYIHTGTYDNAKINRSIVRIFDIELMEVIEGELDEAQKEIDKLRKLLTEDENQSK
jgi:NAD-specific glutamate dehydrogenase